MTRMLVMKNNERYMKISTTMFDLIMVGLIFGMLLPQSISDLKSADFLIFKWTDSSYDKLFGIILFWFSVRFVNFFVSHPRANKAIDNKVREVRPAAEAKP